MTETPRASSGAAGTARTPDADTHLLEACRRGDSGAFEALFRKYQTYVLRVCLGMVGNDEDAADITQEVFLKLHRNLDRFRGEALLSTWLYRVAVNLCLTELRRSRRSRFQFLDDVKHDDEAVLQEELAPCPQELVELDDDRRTVQRVLSMLPPDYRAVMVLRHWQDLDYDEIAEVLGLTLSQVKTRLFRARRMFKERYEGFAGKE